MNASSQSRKRTSRTLGELQGLAAFVSVLVLGFAAPALASTLALVEGESGAAVRQALEQAGVRALVELPGGAAIVELGRGESEALSGTGLALTSARDALGTSWHPTQALRVFRRLATAEPPSIEGRPLCSTLPPDESLQAFRLSIAGDPYRDAIEAQLEDALEATGLRDAEDSILDSSIKMRGRVGVVVYFLESDQSNPAHDEDWAAADVEAVIAGVARSALGWVRVAPPQYALSVVVEVHGPESPVSSIGFEPSHDVPESRWIHQVMAQAGFDLGLGPNAYGLEVRNWAGSTRARLGSDSAVPVFVINDRKNKTSWGDPGWPHVNPIFGYMVLSSTYGNDIVFAHELGHIFFADDEYAASSLYCLCVAQPVGNVRVMASGGNFGETNANCENCNSSPRRCIMLENAWLKGAIDGPDACWHSRAQIGWYETGLLHVEVAAPPELAAEAVDITLDGLPIGSVAARRYLKPGGYELDVRAEGHAASVPMPLLLHLDNQQELHLHVTLTPYSTPTVAAR
jgi:hypothetical protein